VHRAKPPRARWSRSPAGGVLLGLGLAAAATGAGLFGHAQLTIADQSRSIDRFYDARDVLPLRTAGIAVLGVGGLALVGAVLSYALAARRPAL
jgi:hypothetical protein